MEYKIMALIVNGRREIYRTLAEPYLTPQKRQNIELIRKERQSGQTILKGYPYFLTIEPTNVCNLKCPLCPTGSGVNDRPKGFISLEDYKRTVDLLGDYTYAFTLCDWGEPFLHKQIFEMIQYAANRNVMTIVSSNFNYLPPNGLDRLLSSGLSWLIVSLDGASPQTYKHYRRGGNFEVVFRNLTHLMERKRKSGQSLPHIEWSFIVMRHNQHEMHLCLELAEEIGVESVNFTRAEIGDRFNADSSLLEEWLPSQETDRRIDYNQPTRFSEGCPILWDQILVNPDGAVSPCNYVYRMADDFGNLFTQSFEEIWNNDSYVFSRSLFSSVNIEEVQKLRSPNKGCCTKCRYYQKRPDWLQLL